MNMFKHMCEHHIRSIKKMSGDKNIWIYGAGYGGSILYDVCKENGIDIQGFIDKNANKIKEKDGKRVCTIESINPNKDFILISIFEHTLLAKYRDSINQLLFSQGFSPSSIFWIVYGEDYV